MIGGDRNEGDPSAALAAREAEIKVARDFMMT
jgi:hypothetical protein